MERSNNIEIIRRLAEEYNNPRYFQTDPIAFPKHFLQLSSSATQVRSVAVQVRSAAVQVRSMEAQVRYREVVRYR